MILMDMRIRIGISACLLGQPVRYDGGHKLDCYLRDTLGPYVDWVAVCPETGAGLPVPRETMQLVGSAAAPRLVTVGTAVDHTDLLRAWIGSELERLEKLGLCGFVFKSKSPSCGPRGVEVHSPDGGPSHAGVGIFARALVERFPLLPVEDEGRLQEPRLRENFMERVFAFHRA